MLHTRYRARSTARCTASVLLIAIAVVTEIARKGWGNNWRGAIREAASLEHKDRSYVISRQLTVLLRHGRDQLIVPIDVDGYALLSDILQNNVMKQMSCEEEDSLELVSTEPKFRFEVIRAPQRSDTAQRKAQGPG